MSTRRRACFLSFRYSRPLSEGKYPYLTENRRNPYVCGSEEQRDPEKPHAGLCAVSYTHLTLPTNRELLRKAQHNEYEEHDPVYKTFGDVAQQEGFSAVAASFHKIAEIEQAHGNRFGRLADLLEQGKLFVSDVQCAWMCLNCGYIFEGAAAPKVCPVCQHDQGFFVRLEMAPFGDAVLKK